MDSTTRQVHPYWQEAIGTTIVVENMPGAGQTLGTQAYLQTEPDCHTILNALIPVLQFSYMTKPDVDYTYDDFYPIGSTRQDPTVVRVREDAPWQNLQELVDEAIARPGEISVSVGSLTNNQFLAALALEEATGADFNVIPYDGGGPARTALLGGEVDFTIAGVFNSHELNPETRVLGVWQDENEWPDLTEDAPTVNEALGTDLEPNQNREGFFVHRECYEQYPERHQVLVDSFQEAVNDPEYRESLEAVNELGKLNVQSPEEFHEWVLQRTEELQQVVNETPELQDLS